VAPSLGLAALAALVSAWFARGGIDAKVAADRRCDGDDLCAGFGAAEGRGRDPGRSGEAPSGGQCQPGRRRGLPGLGAILPAGFRQGLRTLSVLVPPLPVI